jgi:hypothetical protein
MSNHNLSSAHSDDG